MLSFKEYLYKGNVFAHAIPRHKFFLKNEWFQSRSQVLLTGVNGKNEKKLIADKTRLKILPVLTSERLFICKIVLG
jgi:hypothetical protein